MRWLLHGGNTTFVRSSTSGSMKSWQAAETISIERPSPRVFASSSTDSERTGRFDLRQEAFTLLTLERRDVMNSKTSMSGYDPKLWVWGADSSKPRLLHSMVRVKDFDAALRFYVDGLGMKVLDRFVVKSRPTT